MTAMRIQIRGAREHNLQGIDAEIGDGLTVVTGVSGSGKTSLVFDTVYHEARRRFLEVFSLGSPELQLAPADVETITGLGPAVAVGQNLLNRNPASTLATASGLHPFFRLLYARFGERRCAHCGATLAVLTADEIVERLTSAAERGPLTVCAPLLRGVTGSHRALLGFLAQQFAGDDILVDGRGLAALHATPRGLAPDKPHDVEVVISRWNGPVAASEARTACETAAMLGVNALVVRSDGREAVLSRAAVCAVCGAWFGDLAPVHFRMPCPICAGAGCEQCSQTGLHPQAAAVRWRGLRLPDLLARSVEDAQRLFTDAELPASANRLADEIGRRLDALATVGLGYIALDRPSPTLSRGEAQRVLLAVALTSRLEDVLHVLDEPTIGLHPADVSRLLPAFRQLPGPTIYVEHDRMAAAAADQALDLGPGAGGQGGRLLFSGPPAGLWEADTPTGRYFSLTERVARPPQRAAPDRFLVVRGAHLRNLREIDVRIPLGRLTVITGVSGSGKSTLVEDVLAASLQERRPVGCRAIEGPHVAALMVNQDPIGVNPRSNPATYTKLSDAIRDYFAAATGLSPSHFSFNRPEGACPTCEGMGAVEITMRYLPSTWMPCSACEGQRFSDEVLSAQATLGGNQLSIADLYRLSVSQVAELLAKTRDLPPTIGRAGRSILQALCDVGLGYLPLGQPSPTLSGGEAQRVKLAKYLGRGSLAGRLIILDEPSTGLHAQDVAGLLNVLDRLARRGATVIIVEHNADIIRAADWVVDLGPGAGPAGGRLLYAGPADGLERVEESVTGRGLRDEAAVRPMSAPPKPLSLPGQGDQGHERGQPAGVISIRAAAANNLKRVDVDFPKGRLTVVTGVSGSGKSSLVADVLEAEARRRFLDTLSMYERQSTREGPEAPVESLSGLGVTVTIGPERRMYNRRATVGTATEIAHRLAVLLSWRGERACPECGAALHRTTGRGPAGSTQTWVCSRCAATAPVAQPRHFSSSTYAAACLTCHGVGTLQKPNPSKLIIHPEKPLCAGAMYSPGFFPKGFLGEPLNSGYDLVQALAARYGFDPFATPWNAMTPEAQHAFLFGDPKPMSVTFRSRSQMHTREATFPGFYGWIRDWDVGGTYTDTQSCPQCRGARLRPEYLAVTLGGFNVHELSEMPLAALHRVVAGLSPTIELSRTEAPPAADPAGVNDEPLNVGESTQSRLVGPALRTVQRRLRFLLQVGLGYLHLERPTATLSAGEAQRVKLAGLLGSGLTSLTVLLDEPTRGLHPSEVDALLAALAALRDEGNTVIMVEHDLQAISAADHLVDMGPGAGVEGGQIVAQGAPAAVAQADTVTARWLAGKRSADARRSRRTPSGWMVVCGARANNLSGEDVHLPLGVLVGLCGVSGSGKSTLLIDTVGRALAPKKQTTSVAYEPVEPGRHEAIEAAPSRALVVDQTRSGSASPIAFLDLERPLRGLFADSEDARGLGLDERRLARGCSACGGQGALRVDMGFLPPIHTPCEACHGSGFLAEAWEVRLRGVSLPEALALTIDQVYALFGDEPGLARPLAAAREVGLGYLALRQPGYALSGGEAQRLKIAAELCRRAPAATLYLLDEPTVGQHLEDVERLAAVLHRLVEEGHTVAVIEHHPHLLAACDWLVELGPGGGPDGGRVIASGPPETISRGRTPIAAYLRPILAEDAS